MTRASFLYILSYIIALVFLYLAGFRKVKMHEGFIPLRATVIYLTSLAVVLFVIFAFGILPQSFEATFKQVSLTLVIAIIGACTADLIGKN